MISVIWKAMIAFILVIGTLCRSNGFKELLELLYQ